MLMMEILDAYEYDVGRIGRCGPWKATMQTLDAYNLDRNKLLTTPEKYTVSVVAPGLKKEDFKIQVEKENVSVYVRVSYDVSSETKEIFCNNKFSRTWAFTNCNIDLIDASYEQGILTITIPRIEKKSQIKSIHVK